MTLGRVAMAALLLAVIAPRLSPGVRIALSCAVLVKQELILDEALLKSLPAVTVDVTFETGEGKKSGSYTGVLLWALLEKAGPIDEPGKNAKPPAYAADHRAGRICRGARVSARSIRITRVSR